MSATNRGSERVKNDAYYTPPWCVDRLFECRSFTESIHAGRYLRTLIEPCAGTGSIVKAVERHLPSRPWAASDIDENAVDALHLACNQESCASVEDFLATDELAFREQSDLCITNPPYSLALEFAQKACRRSHMVVFLLRLNWLASAKRHPWIRKHMPDIYVLPNRPSFDGKGTDATDYAWFVWPDTSEYRSSGRVEVLGLTDLKDRRRA